MGPGSVSDVVVGPPLTTVAFDILPTLVIALVLVYLLGTPLPDQVYLDASSPTPTM